MGEASWKENQEKKENKRRWGMAAVGEKKERRRWKWGVAGVIMEKKRKEKKRKTNKMRTDSLIVGIKKKDDKSKYEIKQ